MTYQTFETGLNRRDVLRSAAVLGAVGVFGVPAMSGSVAASSHITETIYLTNTSGTGNGTYKTTLYSVDLDSTPAVAALTELFATSDPNFQRVDAIAGSPDGASVVFIDRDTSHLGRYIVGSGAFADLGPISGLPALTVLAAYGLDGTLYAASNTSNSLYTIDVSGPSATLVGEIDGATVNGADIVIDANGTMFLHSNADDTLYTIDYQNPSGGFVTATEVGTDSGASLTGLAVRGAGTGDLVGSSRDNVIIVLNKTTGQREVPEYTMTLPDGSELDYLNGDMATGVLVDETCDECDIEEMIKYEYEVDEETGEVLVDTFAADPGTDSVVFVSYEGDAGEPMTATFETDYCSVWAVVKSGQEFEVQGFGDTVSEEENRVFSIDDGELTVETANDEKYAISFVAFFCSEEAAQSYAENFPSRGKGGGKGNQD